MLSIFAQGLNEKTLQQIKETEVKYPDSKIAIMPDAHPGSGCVIGTTITMPSITTPVDPKTTGVDLNCGVLVTRLDKPIIDFKELDTVINNYVPSGRDVNNTSKVNFNRLGGLRCKEFVNIQRGYLALGTLGGGNHFIEVDIDEQGIQYIIIHSGSRGIGHQVATYYIRRAKKGNYRERIQQLIATYKKEGRQKEIGFALDGFSKSHVTGGMLEGTLLKDYIHDIDVMSSYALSNRLGILTSILNKMKGSYYTSARMNMFDTKHNYIDTKTATIRKGAVSAKNGELIAIPLNMRDGTLICIGKGNPDWNYSAPHGAGRLFSRTQAKADLDMDTFKQSMKGVYSTSINLNTLDESPPAYKDAQEIINLIEPTATIIHKLTPVYNFKAS